MDLIIAEYGNVKDWNLCSSKYNYETGEWDVIDEGDKPFENFIAPQLNVIKICETPSDCFASSYTDPGGENSMTLDGDESEIELSGAAILADGSSFGIDIGVQDGFFVFDTNGPKAPNVLGRDLFVLLYDLGLGKHNLDFKPGFILNWWSAKEPDGCDPSYKEYFGFDCGSRLFQEGKMNY